MDFVCIRIRKTIQASDAPVGTNNKPKAEVPDVEYSGDDPQKAPEGTEWKGPGEKGSSEGNYYNPQTGESWHPDLNHPAPIGPHWDYNYRGSGCDGWRVFPDGGVAPKAIKPVMMLY